MRSFRYAIAATVIAASTASAQSPGSLTEIGSHPDEASISSMSAANPWIGAELKWKAKGGDFADNLLGKAEVLFTPKGWADADDKMDKWHVPVIANFTKVMSDGLQSAPKKIDELISSDDGIQGGIYPYWRISGKPGTNGVIFYSFLTDKFNATKDSASGKKQYVNQFRGSGGLEVQWTSKQEFGAGSVGGNFIYGSEAGTSDLKKIAGFELSSLMSVEFTGTLRVYKGYGLLAEYVIPLGDAKEVANNQFHFGILFLKSK